MIMAVEIVVVSIIIIAYWPHRVDVPYVLFKPLVSGLEPILNHVHGSCNVLAQPRRCTRTLGAQALEVSARELGCQGR